MNDRRAEHLHRDDATMAATELIRFYVEAQDEDHQTSALQQAANFLDDLCKDQEFCPDMVSNIQDFLIKASKQLEALSDINSARGWKLFLVLRALVMKGNQKVVSATSSAGFPLTVVRLLEVIHKDSPNDEQEAIIFSLLCSMCKHDTAVQFVLDTGLLARLLQLVVYPELSTPSIRAGVLSLMGVITTCFPIALVTFVQSSQSLSLLLSALTPERDPPLDFAVPVFTMIRQLLEVSLATKVHGTRESLLDDFQRAQGYTVLKEFLKWRLNIDLQQDAKKELRTEDEDGVKEVVIHTKATPLVQINIVKSFLEGFCELVYIGDEVIQPSVEQLTRAQIPEKLRRAPPTLEGHRDEAMHNLTAFECLLELFVTLESDVFRLQCLQYMFNVVRSNTMNYLVVRESFIPSLMGKVSSCSAELKRNIFKVVRFSLLSTDFVPYQEACLMVNYLKRSDLDTETELHILECLSQALTEDLVEQQKLLTEAGLLTHVYSIIRNYHSQKLKANSTHDRVRETEDRHPKTVSAWLDCLYWLMKNNLGCIDLEQVRVWLMDYFKYGNSEIRPQALRLMEDFVLTVLHGRDSDKRSKSVAEYINNLLTFLKDLPPHDISSQCLILRSLRTLLQEDKSPRKSAQDIFFKRGGLRSTVSLLERLGDPSELLAKLDQQRNRISPSPSVAASIQVENDRLLFVRHVILTLIATLSGKPEHRKSWQRTIGFDRLAFIIQQLGIRTHALGSSCVVSWFLWIAIEYIPAADRHQDPLSPVHRPNALSTSNSFPSSPTSTHHSMLPVPLPEAALIFNPSAILPVLSLLPHCDISFQLQTMGYLYRLCKNEVHNRVILAEEGLMSSIIHAFWQLFQDDSLTLSSSQSFALLDSLHDAPKISSTILSKSPTGSPDTSSSRRVSIVTTNLKSSVSLSQSPQASPKSRSRHSSLVSSQQTTTPPRLIKEGDTLAESGRSTPPTAVTSSICALSLSSSSSASSDETAEEKKALPIETSKGDLFVGLLQLIQLLVVFTPKSAVLLNPIFSLLEVNNPHVVNALIHMIKEAQFNGKLWPYISFDGVDASSGSEPGYVVINTVKTQSAKGSFPADSYTLMLWLHISNFGGSDAQIRLFALKSNDSRKSAPLLNLFFQRQFLHACDQTGSGTAVFKYPFEAERWYHVALSHQRGKMLSKSAMILYVNGKQEESLHVSYPPAVLGVVRGVIGNDRADDVLEADDRSGPAVEDPSVQWRLAGCLMTDGCLPPQSIRGCYEARDNVSPRQSADAASELLASHTFPALSQLSEGMGYHKWVPESPNLCHIAYPQRFQTSLPSDISADQVLFFFHASASEGSKKRLLNQSRSLSVFAELRGSSKVYVPHGLPELLPVVGGLVRVFAFIARATTKRQLRLSLLLLGSLLQDNSCNHKEMVRIMGFPILNHILKHRIHLVDRHVINLLFGFCGLGDGGTSGEIVNTAAFEAFFLDWGLWHSCSPRCKVYVFQCWHASLTVNPNCSKNLAMMRSLKMLDWLCAFLGNVKLVDDLIHVGDHVRMLIGEFLSNNSTKAELKEVAEWIVSPVSSICYIVPQSVLKTRKVNGRRKVVGPYVDLTDEPSSEDDEGEVVSTRTVCTRVLLLEVICSLLQRQPGLRTHVVEVLTLDWVFGVLFRAKHLWSQEMEAQECVAAVCVVKLLSTLFVWRPESKKEFAQSGHLILSQLLSDAHACNDVEIYRVLLCTLVGISPDEVSSELSSLLKLDREFSVKVPELLGVIFSVLETRLICQCEIQMSAENDPIVTELVEVLLKLCDHCSEVRAAMLTSQNLLALLKVFFWRSKPTEQDSISAFSSEHNTITADIAIFDHGESHSPAQTTIEEKSKLELSSFRDPSSEAIFRIITKLALDSLYAPNINTLLEILDCAPFYASAQQRTEFQTKMFQELGLAIMADDAQFTANLVAMPSLLSNFRQMCEHWLLWSNHNYGEGIKRLLEMLARLLSSPVLLQDTSSGLLRWGSSNKTTKEELTKTLQSALLLAYAYVHGGKRADEKGWGPRTQPKTWKHDLIWLHEFVSRCSHEVFGDKNSSDLIGPFLFHLFYDFIEELSGSLGKSNVDNGLLEDISEQKEDSELYLLREGAFAILQEVWKPDLTDRLVLARNKYKPDEQSKRKFEVLFQDGHATLQQPTSQDFRAWVSQHTKPLSKALASTLTADWKQHWARLQEQTGLMVTNPQRSSRLRQGKIDLEEQFKSVKSGKQRLLTQMHTIHVQTLSYLRAWVQNSENWQRAAEALWWRMVGDLKDFEHRITQHEQKVFEEKSLIGVDMKELGFEPLPMEMWREHERPGWGLEEKHFWTPGSKIGITLKAEDFSDQYGHGGSGMGGYGDGKGEGSGVSGHGSRRSSIGGTPGNGEGSGSGDGSGHGEANGEGKGEGKGEGNGEGNGQGNGEGNGQGEGPGKGSPEKGESAGTDELKSSMLDEIQRKLEEAEKKKLEENQPEAEFSEFEAPPPPEPPPPDAPPLDFDMPVAREEPTGPQLRRFHWEKMQGVDISKTVWGNLGELELDLDMERFEESFTAAVSAVKKVEQKPTTTLVKFTNARRSQVVEIGLARFNMSVTEIREAILSIDPRLDAFKLKRLVQFLPTFQEIEQVESYKGDPALLGGAEKFFREMACVPHVAARVRALTFCCTFHSTYEDILFRLALVESCREKIEKSTSLRQVLAVVLQLGNRMNQATSKGQAMGFRLASLGRLRQTKTADNKSSLLHYLVEHVHNKIPQGRDFLVELDGLKEGARIETAQLQSEVSALGEGLEDFQASIDLVGTAESSAVLFHKHCAGISRTATKELAVLKTQLSSCVDKCNDLALYFGEASLMGWEELFSIFNEFCLAFKQAEADIDKQKELVDAARKRQQLAESLQRAKKSSQSSLVSSSDHNPH